MTRDEAQAARLIDWGFRPRDRPSQQAEYDALVARFEQDADFAQLVHDIADGMHLKVLSVSEMGIVLAPTEESVHAFKPSDFRRHQRSEDRIFDGLIQVAIAATLFPRAADLEEDPTVVRPAIKAPDVDETLRGLAESHRARNAEAPDPPASAEDAGLIETWRVYDRRHARRETADGRAAPYDTLRLITLHLDKLTDLGCFIKQGEGDEAEYTATWRYQVLVKEFAATRLYDALFEQAGGSS